MNKPMRVTFYPGRPAKGRTKAKPWSLIIGSETTGALRINPAWEGQDPYRYWAIVTAMVDDFNALHLDDIQVEEAAETLRETFPVWWEQQRG